MDYTAQHRGFIALISVLIVGVVGVSIATSLILLGLGSSKTSFALEQSAQAKALAMACAEEGLQKIQESTSYTGNGTLTLGQGACAYTVASQGGQNRTVSAYSTVGTLVRKEKIIITRVNPTIEIDSWQEVADF